jgi:uncharacterized Zn-binding protein involved in type VI secretion
MLLKIIVVSARTDQGEKIISGSPSHDVDGKSIARLGDLVSVLSIIQEVNQLTSTRSSPSTTLFPWAALR